MKLSVSVNLFSLLDKKKIFWERFLIWHTLGVLDKEIFLKFQASHIEGIELVLHKNISDKNILAVKKLLKLYKMPVLSVHQPLVYALHLSFPEIKKLFIVAAKLSAKIIVIHLQAVRNKLEDQDFLAKLRALEKKYKIKIALENSPKYPLIRFKKRIWHEHEDEFSKTVLKSGFKINFDTTHLATTKGDILKFFKKNKAEIINLHLSDFKPGRIGKQHLALGKGNLPIKRFINLLKTENYSGVVTFEINDSVEAIIEGAKLFS